MLRSPNRVVAFLAGAGFVTLGVAGFFAADGLLFGVFGVDVASSIVHLVFGVSLVVAGIAGVRAARFANGAVGAVCLVIGYTGLFVVGGEYNVLGLNGAGNVLHFGVAALLLAVGLGAEGLGAERAAKRA
ncbi:MAG: DUF4383 domain-containing protein [Microbacteriaceae bacterium]